MMRRQAVSRTLSFRRLACAILFLLGFSTEDVRAHEPFGGCSEGEIPFYGQKIVFGRMIRNEILRHEKNGCPAADNKACDADQELKLGDQVIVARNSLGWSCVWKSGSEKIKGWVPQKSIKKIPENRLNLYEWAGKWVNGPNAIDITTIRQNGSTLLDVRATAFWNGGEGNVHTGSLRKTGHPVGNALYLEDEQLCQVLMTRVGKALVVYDNGRCGGMNVRLDGVYKRE